MLGSNHPMRDRPYSCPSDANKNVGQATEQGSSSFVRAQRDSTASGVRTDTHLREIGGLTTDYSVRTVSADASTAQGTGPGARH
jgi:hypothetical protein